MIVVSSGFALAANPFTDVPSGQFYADAVDWAYNNSITTGSPAGSTTFKPNDPVTRGENITFAKRYDDNIVQPALTDRLTTDDNVGMFDSATGAAQSFASLTDLPIVSAEVTVTIPEGHTGYVDLNFVAETTCTGGTGGLLFGPWCEVKFYDESGAIYGNGAAFDSPDIGGGGTAEGIYSWEGHAAGFVTDALAAGTHTFTAYARSAGTAAATFVVGDWSFTAQVHLAS